MCAAAQYCVKHQSHLYSFLITYIKPRFEIFTVQVYLYVREQYLLLTLIGTFSPDERPEENPALHRTDFRVCALGQAETVFGLCCVQGREVTAATSISEVQVPHTHDCVYCVLFI